jgi:hypothetical protein
LSNVARRLAGLDVTVRVVSPRRRIEGEAKVEATFTDHGATEAPRHREFFQIVEFFGTKGACV